MVGSVGHAMSLPRGTMTEGDSQAPARRAFSTCGSVSGRSSAIRPGPNALRAFAVQPDRGAGGLEGRHALRQQAGDEAGEHVAGAGGGEPRRGVVVDGGAAVGRGDHGVGPLEDDDGAAALGGAARALELAARQLAEQALELAFVRREDDRCRARLDRLEQAPASGAARRRARRSQSPRRAPAPRPRPGRTR